MRVLFYLVLLLGLGIAVRASLPAPQFAQTLDGAVTRGYVASLTPEKAPQVGGNLTLDYADLFQLGVEMVEPDLAGAGISAQSVVWKFVWYLDNGLISGLFPDCRLVAGTSVEDEQNNGCWTDYTEHNPFTPVLRASSAATYKVVASYTVTTTSGTVMTSTQATCSLPVTVTDMVYVANEWLPLSTSLAFVDTDSRLYYIDGTLTWGSSTAQVAEQSDMRFIDNVAQLFYQVQICNSTSCSLLQEVLLKSVTGFTTSVSLNPAIQIETNQLTSFRLRVVFRDGAHDSESINYVEHIFVDDQETPGSAIEDVEVDDFIDTDYNPNLVQGTLRFSRVSGDVSPLYLGYHLYLAIGPGVSDRQSVPIGTLMLSQLDATHGVFSIPQGTAVGQTTFFQIVPFNHGGDSEYSRMVFAKDLATPTTTVTDVQFNDIDLTQGRIEGTLSFARAPLDVEATYYFLYWANGTQKENRISKIAQLALVTIQSSSTRLSFQVPNSEIVGKYLQVVLVNQYGISNYANSTQFWDKAVPTQADVDTDTAPNFLDENLNIDALTGNFSFASRANVSGWQIWIATSTTKTSRQYRLTTLLASSAILFNSTYTYKYRISINVVNYGSKLHLVPFNAAGDSSFFYFYSAEDRAIPTALVRDLSAQDKNKDQGEVLPRVTFSRPVVHESLLRPPVTGYKFYLGKSQNGSVLYQSTPVKVVTWQSLSPDVASAGATHTLDLSAFSDPNNEYTHVMVKSYGTLDVATVFVSAPLVDVAIPFPSTVATDIHFQDVEELPDKIRGWLSFSMPCVEADLKWQLYLTDGSEYTNKTSGLINQNLYTDASLNFVGGLQSTGGKFGVLLKTLVQTTNTSCLTGTNFSIPFDMDSGYDATSRIDTAIQALTITSSQKYFSVVASNADGECRFGAIVPFDDKASPRAQAQSIAFLDRNLTLFSVEGNVSFVRADDESYVEGYKLWIVPAITRAARLSDGVLLSDTKLANLPPTERTISYMMQNVRIEGTYFFHVHTYNNYGDGEAITYEVFDRALPETAAIDIRFTDEDVDQNEIYGEIFFSGVPNAQLAPLDHSMTISYRVYLASGPSLADRGTLLEDVKICGSVATTSCTGAYSIFLPFNTNIKQYSYFHFVSVGVQGEGDFSTFNFEDVVGLAETVGAVAATSAVAAAAAAGASSAMAGGMSGVSGAANAAGASGQASGASSSSSSSSGNAWGMINNFQTTGANSQMSSDFPSQYQGYAQSMQWANGDVGFSLSGGPSYTKDELAVAGASRISNGRTPEANFLISFLMCCALIVLDIVVLAVFWFVAQRRLEKRLQEEYRTTEHIDLFDQKTKEEKRKRAEALRKEKEAARLRKQQEKAEKAGKVFKPKKPVEKVPKQWKMASFIVRILVVLYYALMTASLFQVRSGKSSTVSALAVVVLLFVGIGVPLANILLLISRARAHRLQQAKQQVSAEKQYKKLNIIFGPFLGEYKDSGKWFMIATTLRKLSMSVCVVMLVASGRSQAIMMFVIFVVNFFLLFTDPFPGHWGFDCQMEIVMCLLNIYALAVAAFVPVHVQEGTPFIGMSLVAGQMLCILVFMAVSFNSIRKLVTQALRNREQQLREQAKEKIQLRKKQLSLAMQDSDDNADAQVDGPPTRVSATPAVVMVTHQGDNEDGDLFDDQPVVQMAGQGSLTTRTSTTTANGYNRDKTFADTSFSYPRNTSVPISEDDDFEEPIVEAVDYASFPRLSSNQRNQFLQ